MPRVGVSQISVSCDSVYLATVNEQCPSMIWIWDLVKCTLNSIIQQKDLVKSIEWAPNSLNLNISSGDNKIFLWSLKGASICQVPPMMSKSSFKVSDVKWNPNGKNFAAVEHNQGLVFVYPQQ